MASSELGAASPGRRIAAILNNPAVRGAVFQVAFVAVLGWLIWDIIQNTAHNLQKANIAAGYGFLGRTAGFGIIQKFVDYTEASSYGRAVYVGLLNTLAVAGLGVVLATIIGFVVGVARLSSNWLIAQLAAIYVEVIRNIPLLLQLFFWYFAVLRSVPGMREKWSLFGLFHINIGGLHVPRPVVEDGFGWVVGAVPVAIAIAIFVARWGKERQEATGGRPPIGAINTAVIIGLPILVFFLVGRPLVFDIPLFNETGPLLRRGFQAGSGLTVIPEFVGLLLALSLYTAAYIAEIVRAGILAVSHGQTEAAHSLGLRSGQTLRLVVIPQAMRVIIPPLTNQYLNLTKNSSLAVAVAYPDLVSVGGTVLNQTGQAIEMVSIWMLFYLGLSLITSFVMNQWNKRVALIER
ncbi:amino acid ABC transporter permease [Kaistia dalseonensis]|uniref:General L-amino acid transport system permease protein n=1 Tax=Kaistia dalseonensis TaxID=410840 RepID=A0ABU0H423_9HYPH|nr:amino acid ABC transporter permease [Kaistia dalseonensis]MCX5493664.1 amino acid ABC transporter permease [Kaistia dalseonensis]MDQ0436226.1 general L-amino acid transport system permease protein [Kaistia dalseonensis]